MGFYQKAMMRKTLLLSMCLFSVTRCEQPKIQASGQEGGLIHISCPYEAGYETYPKYFYKGIYAERKVVVKTTDKTCEEKTQKRKYDLCDDTKERILQVTIYDLTLKDAGTYWCLIDTYVFDPKTEVELRVSKAPAPVKPRLVTLNPPVSTTVETTMNQQQPATNTVTVNTSETAEFTPSQVEHTGKAAYFGAAAAAAAAAVLLASLLLLCLRVRKRGRDAARGSPDIVYAAVTRRRCPDAQRINQNKNVCSSPADHHDSQPRNQTVAAEHSVTYATIKHPNH